MARSERSTAADPLAETLRNLYRAEIDEQRHCIGDPAIARMRAQTRLQLGLSARPDRLPLLLRALAIAALAGVVGLWWGGVTEEISELLVESGVGLNGHWASRISEIIATSPMALLRTLLT